MTAREACPLKEKAARARKGNDSRADRQEFGQGVEDSQNPHVRQEEKRQDQAAHRILLTVVGDNLYHNFARKIRGFEDATAKKIYRKFTNSSGNVTIGKREIVVCFRRPAHNPLLLEAGFDAKTVRVPWLNGYTLRFRFL